MTVEHFVGAYMKALILCDGYGKKESANEGGSNALFVLTDGFTAIDKLLLDLATVELREAVLLTNVSSRQLQERLGTEHKSVKLSYEHGQRTSKDVGLALTKMGDDVLVLDCGVVTDINLKKMITKFTHSEAPVMAYITASSESSSSIDRLSKMLFGSESSAVYGGIFCVRKGFDLGRFVLGEGLEGAFDMLADLGQLDAYEEFNFWDTIYTEDGKQRIREEFRDKTVKPWGYEKVQIITELYLLKELYIREGYQSSYHFHKNKDETMLILRGDGFIQFDDRKEYFSTGDTIRIKPYEKHTIVANADTILYEASTPFLEDTTRVKDFYAVR
jgi:mannose-6-phosphate isomerase-like protein (cupin superfamily)